MSPGAMSERLAAKLVRDGWPAEVGEQLDGIDLRGDGSSEGLNRRNERIHVAILLLSKGPDPVWQDVVSAVDLARTDWRDVLVAAGLAHEDWRERVERWFTEG